MSQFNKQWGTKEGAIPIGIGWFLHLVHFPVKSFSVHFGVRWVHIMLKVEYGRNWEEDIYGHIPKFRIVWFTIYISLRAIIDEVRISVPIWFYNPSKVKKYDS